MIKKVAMRLAALAAFAIVSRAATVFGLFVGFCFHAVVQFGEHTREETGLGLRLRLLGF
jgi:hypothetical protein